MQVRILSPGCMHIARNQPSARAHGAQEREEERESELERSKLPNYASVHTKHLLPAHHSQWVQCARTLRGDTFLSLVFVHCRNPKGGCTPAWYNMRRYLSLLLHTTAHNCTRLPNASLSPSVTTIRFAHLPRKRNSFRGWGLRLKQCACCKNSLVDSASELLWL